MPVLQQPDDDSLLDFGTASGAGDLQRVTELTEERSRPLDYLSVGLCNALLARQIEVARYLLDQGALIDGRAQRCAVHSNSVEVLQLLLEYGWNVNDAAMDGEVVLP